MLTAAAAASAMVVAASWSSSASFRIDNDLSSTACEIKQQAAAIIWIDPPYPLVLVGQIAGLK
jgi:16S rRNA G966 N2-methylase RsmD